MSKDLPFIGTQAIAKRLSNFAFPSAVCAPGPARGPTHRADVGAATRAATYLAITPRLVSSERKILGGAGVEVLSGWLPRASV